MSIARHHGGIFKVATTILALASGGALCGQIVPAPAPPSTAPAIPRPRSDPAHATPLVFQDVPVSTILEAMSQRYGFVIVSTDLPPSHVTVRFPDDQGPREAVHTLNQILESLGYVALVTNTSPDPKTPEAGSTILRIVPANDARSQVEVFKGADAGDIPLNDDLRTQIVPIENITAAGLLNELRPLISRDADLAADSASNSIIITDTAAKIHRLVAIIHSLDATKKLASTYRYTQLRNASATDAAQLINAMFAPQSTAPEAATGRGGGPPAGASTAGLAPGAVPAPPAPQ